jgi:hypothetical protein
MCYDATCLDEEEIQPLGGVTLTLFSTSTISHALISTIEKEIHEGSAR